VGASRHAAAYGRGLVCYSHAHTVASPLVVATKVQKSFRHMGRTLEVLRGIDLEINDGEMLCIVGPSGAGKSTLLHCIGTLDVPTRGSIRLAGEEITAMNGARLAELRNRTIGFVFQFHHLLPEFNAVENVMMPGLGGEQQRVALARALMLEPKLLLADEPTGNLDSATSTQIHDLIFSINKQRGTTIVVVTHNPVLADSMPRVVTLRDGRVETDERREVPAREAPGQAPAEAASASAR